MTTNANTLLQLLAEAECGRIHLALGYRSWTAYVKDRAQITVTDKLERKALVSLMSGKGISQRSTAAVVAVDQKNVGTGLRT